MKRSLTLLAVVVAVAAGAGYWYVQGKLPQREGEVAMAGLQARRSLRYDGRGVPHLQAQSEPDPVSRPGLCACPGPAVPDGDPAPAGPW